MAHSPSLSYRRQHTLCRPKTSYTAADAAPGMVPDFRAHLGKGHGTTAPVEYPEVRTMAGRAIE
jgi:hypothetical protein